MMTPEELQSLLETQVQRRNRSYELSHDRPDPLLVASKYRNESIALICALFGYGNARQIVKFLESLDFSLLESSDDTIRSSLNFHYYRFQKGEDIAALFIALKRLSEESTLEEIFYTGYRKECSVLDGLWKLIIALHSINPHDTPGYRFLLGSVPKNLNSAGCYKRYMMYLRWMIRHDELDMGLWKKIDKRDLIMPLDTHTFHISRKIGLLERRSCDMKAALELTEKLRMFDSKDPVKYDFALYRIGQEKLMEDALKT